MEFRSSHVDIRLLSSWPRSQGDEACIAIQVSRLGWYAASFCIFSLAANSFFFGRSSGVRKVLLKGSVRQETFFYFIFRYFPTIKVIVFVNARSRTTLKVWTSKKAFNKTTTLPRSTKSLLHKAHFNPFLRLPSYPSQVILVSDLLPNLSRRISADSCYMHDWIHFVHSFTP